MNFFRFMFGFPGAAAVTLVLFAMMAALIAQDPRINTPTEPPDISVVAKLKPTPPAPDGKPTRLDPDDAPPPVDTKWREPKEGVKSIPSPNPTGGEFDPIGPMKGATPIIRFAPPYPEACRARGAEGVVLVQFDVTARGEVTNVRIISSDHRCFDRTVTKTVTGWKYPPEARRGVTERFVFTLTE